MRGGGPSRMREPISDADVAGTTLPHLLERFYRANFRVHSLPSGTNRTIVQLHGQVDQKGPAKEIPCGTTCAAIFDGTLAYPRVKPTAADW